MSKKKISILHLADLHLARSFDLDSIVGSDFQLRREEIWQSLERALAYGDSYGVSLVLLAGDLYENETMTLSNLDRLAYIFSKYSHMNFFIVFGNHDHMGPKSHYLKSVVGENVHIFDDYLDYVQIGNIRVYGYSWSRLNYQTRPFDYPILDKNFFNIFLIHGTIGSRSDYLPLNKSELEAASFDYVALGHIHQAQKVAESIYYPGSLEALDFSSGSRHGGLVIDLVDRDMKVDFVEFSTRSYHNLQYDLSHDWDSFGLIGSLNDFLGQIKKDDYIRLNIIGSRDARIDMEEVKLYLDRNYENLNLIDSSKAGIKLEDLIRQNKDNIIGRYFSQVLENYQGQEKDALVEIGLEAILGDFGLED